MLTKRVALIAAGVLALSSIFVVQARRRRFKRRIASEMDAMISKNHSTRVERDALPSPVARYRDLAVGDQPPVSHVTMRHGGSFTMSASSAPKRIEGIQRFTSDPPGFLWWGRISLFPGVWVDACDTSIHGIGGMRVEMENIVRIADAKGAEIDQGSALRLLAEMVWMPTAYFDRRYVTWSEIDDQHARATLKIGATLVTAVFEFGEDGMPVEVRAERNMDKVGLRPWVGCYRDWRLVSGLRVPFEADVTWQLEDGPFTYCRWRVEQIAAGRTAARSSGMSSASRS